MGYCTATLTQQIAALLRIEASKPRRCQQYHFSEPTLPSGKPAVQVDAQGNGGGLVNVSPAFNVEFEALVSTHRAPEGAHIGKATVATYCHFLLDEDLAKAFVGVARRATNIVSLVPSATEAAAAVLGSHGFKARVIGRSSYCDFPRSVIQLPIVSQSSLDFDENLTGAEVEAEMREAKMRPGVPHVADTTFLRTHRPGIVLVQDSCPACGIVAGTAHAALEAAGLDTGELRKHVLGRSMWR